MPENSSPGSQPAAWPGDVVYELAEIRASLKVLTAGQDDICRRIDIDITKRLDKVNGSISTLYGRADQNKEALLNHIIECPQKEKIEQTEAVLMVLKEQIFKLDNTLGQQLAVAKATEAQSSQWKEKLLYPLIRIALTGLALILLYNAKIAFEKLF